MITLKEDQLGRKDLLDALFEIFSSYSNQDSEGLTIAINGKYGTGKSTFLDFIKERNQIENDKFNVVKYDAWEGNFFDNPIIPIMHTISKINSTSGIIKKAANKVIKKIPKMVLKTLANITGVDTSSTLDENIFKDFTEFKKSIEECKKVLTEVSSNKRIIFLVDELDRCLPAYQIKVLESLYHFINVPNLIVVIALDREQLEEAVRIEFGTSTDTSGYLSKFIQYEIELPNDLTREYALKLINFNCGRKDDVEKIISSIIAALEMSTRDMKIFINQLNLVCKSHGSCEYFFPVIASFMVLLKSKDKVIYDKYFKQDTGLKKDVPFEETNYYSFLCDIKNTEVEKVIDVILNHPSKLFILSTIGIFDNIKWITLNGNFVNYLGTDKRLVEHFYSNDFMRWIYANGVEKLINQLKIIK